MIYFLALLPATALTIGGYFVLFLSNRSEGHFQTFGRYLGFWAFTLAGLVILGAIFAAAAGVGRHERGYPGHDGLFLMRPFGGYLPIGPGELLPPPPPNAPAPVSPNAPTTAPSPTPNP